MLLLQLSIHLYLRHKRQHHYWLIALSLVGYSTTLYLHCVFMIFSLWRPIFFLFWCDFHSVCLPFLTLNLCFFIFHPWCWSLCDYWLIADCLNDCITALTSFYCADLFLLESCWSRHYGHIYIFIEITVMTVTMRCSGKVQTTDRYPTNRQIQLRSVLWISYFICPFIRMYVC